MGKKKREAHLSNGTYFSLFILMVIMISVDIVAKDPIMLAGSVILAAMILYVFVIDKKSLYEEKKKNKSKK